MQGVPKIDYLQCQKGGFHYGQFLNMVCLQPSCHDKMLSCCACIEEHHKQHNAKPLRLVLLEANKMALSIIPNQLNTDIAFQLINTNLKQSIQSFNKIKKSFVAGLQSIQNSIISYYSFLVEQVKLKNTDPRVELERVFHNIQTKNTEQKEYVYSVKKLIGIISAKKQEQSLTQADILASLNAAIDELKKCMQTQAQKILNQTTSCQNSIDALSVHAKFWKQPSYKFSNTLKHPDVKVLSDHIAKASANSGYKFALMEPKLEKGEQIKDYAFKIKESTANWIAVGMCHKNIVASKSYCFNFTVLGHGAYMISSNGGSWNSANASQNNSIKAFKFTKGDIVTIRTNFKDKTITFKHNENKNVLNFQTIAGDQLYPCVLFYYANDEVQFLPNYKFQ